MSTARRLSARVIATLVLLAFGVLVMNLPALLKRRGPALDLWRSSTFVDSVPARAGAPRPDSQQVASALGRVMDPELDLSVLELGLVEKQELDSSGNVKVLMLLTTPECPYSALMGGRAVRELKLVPGIRRIEVRLDPTIEWQPERLSEEGKRRFRRLFGDGRDTGK